MLTDISFKYVVASISDSDKYKNPDISCMMREVTGWKSSLKDLTKSNFQELTVVHRLSEDLMDAGSLRWRQSGML